jgi:YD repeat-containing protein
LARVSFGSTSREFTYDGTGNTATARNVELRQGAGLGYYYVIEKRSFTYDSLNRLARTDWTNSLSAGVAGHYIAYSYDAQDRRVGVTDRWGAAHAYGYDAADRLVSATAPSGKVTAFENDAADRPVKIKFPSGLETRISYDTGLASGSTGRVKSVTRGLTQAGSGGPLLIHPPLNALLGTFNYDSRGSITAVTEPRRAGSRQPQPLPIRRCRSERVSCLLPASSSSMPKVSR